MPHRRQYDQDKESLALEASLTFVGYTSWRRASISCQRQRSCRHRSRHWMLVVVKTVGEEGERSWSRRLPFFSLRCLRQLCAKEQGWEILCPKQWRGPPVSARLRESASGAPTWSAYPGHIKWDYAKVNRREHASSRSLLWLSREDYDRTVWATPSVEHQTDKLPLFALYTQLTRWLGISNYSLPLLCLYIPPLIILLGETHLCVGCYLAAQLYERWVEPATVDTWLEMNHANAFYLQHRWGNNDIADML